MPLPIAERKNEREFGEFKRPDWFIPTVGQHRIRLLQPLSKANIQYVHWIARQKNYVNCLGEEECPICKNNKKIELENPQTFTKEPGWNPFSTKYSINIYDRTLVKVCSNCGSENKMLVTKTGQDFSPTCWKCNTAIIGEAATPSNTVKIISRHLPLFEDLETLEKTVLDIEGNSIPITSYDISLNVTKKDRGYNIMPVPMTHLNDRLEISEDDMFDLEEVKIILTPEEVIQFVRGVTLKDIFTARSAESSEVKSEEVVEKEEEVLAFAQDTVENLFSQFKG